MLKKWFNRRFRKEPVADSKFVPEVIERAGPPIAVQEPSPASYIAQLGSLTLVAREVKPYEPPPGVIGSDGLAMDEAPPAFGPAGPWFAGMQQGLGFPGYAYLAELAQRSEYRAPSETLAKEMTRKFIKFLSRGEGDKGDKIERLEAWFKKHDIRQILRKTLELDLFFGRAQIFLHFEGDEGETRALPLIISKETIKPGSFRRFKVIEPIWTTPYFYNSLDPTSEHFYRPSHWYILGQRVHRDRLLTVVSRPVPDLLKPAYNFGGISLTQLMEPYVIRWLKTVDSVSRLISNYSVLLMKTDMQAVLSGTDGGDWFRRLRLFTSTRDNQGVMTLNKDSEEMEQIAVPLGGLAELQAQQQEHMAAPSHIPLVKLTGITPAGLNATSEGEIQVFYDFIMAENETVVEPILDVILDIAQLDEFGEIDEEIDYEFVPLTEPTRKEVAEMTKAKIDGIVSLIGTSVISPDEARENLQQDPDSGFNNLNGDAPEPMIDDSEGGKTEEGE